jgi:hypothetical protein
MFRRLVALSLLASLAPLPALAEPSKAELATARKLFEEAQTNEQEGQWLDALEQLRQILAIKETAGVRFHMALCEQHLGQLLGARADFQRSAELASRMNNEEGRGILARCATELDALKQRIPRLTVQGDGSAGLQIDLDGFPLEEARRGRPIDRETGEAAVRARAPGKQPFERRVQLVEGSNLTITVAFEALPAPVAPASASASGSELPPPLANGNSGSLLPWMVGGASLISGAASAFFFVNYRRLRRETDDICGDPNYSCDRQAREDRINQYRLATFTTGGLWLLGTGLTVYLAATSPSEPPTISLRLGPGGAALSGRW